MKVWRIPSFRSMHKLTAHDMECTWIPCHVNDVSLEVSNRETACCIKAQVSALLVTCLVIVVMGWDGVCETGQLRGLLFHCRDDTWVNANALRNDTDRRNRITRRKSCPSAIQFTTNTIRTDRDANPVWLVTSRRLKYMDLASHVFC